MQKYRKIKTLRPIEFRRLTGVRPETFQEMVAILQDAEKKRMSRGGKPHRLKSDKYRNRRKRFGLRLNLIAGIYNPRNGS